MAWIRDNPEKTIGDAIEKYEELKRCKSQRKIGSQFEYNQYTRDFFAENPTLTRKDCISCWDKVKMTNNRRYKKEDLLYLPEHRIQNNHVK